MTSQEIQVRVAVLRHVLHARPVSPESLGTATGLTTSEVHAALTALHEAERSTLRTEPSASRIPSLSSQPSTAYSSARRRFMWTGASKLVRMRGFWRRQSNNQAAIPAGYSKKVNQLGRAGRI